MNVVGGHIHSSRGKKNRPPPLHDDLVNRETAPFKCCLFVCLFVFSGLRGAVAFALVLHLQLDDEKRHVLITSTLIIIMFTILCLGGSTLPLLKVTCAS